MSTEEDGVGGEFSLHSQWKSTKSPDFARWCSTHRPLCDSRMLLSGHCCIPPNQDRERGVNEVSEQSWGDSVQAALELRHSLTCSLALLEKSCMFSYIK